MPEGRTRWLAAACQENLRRAILASKREPSPRSKVKFACEPSLPASSRRSTRKWRERSVESKRVSDMRRV
jgi:hypothetical protein